MKKESKPIYFTYNVLFLNKETVKFIITSSPPIEKKEIKFAEINKPEKFLTFEQLSNIISGTYHKEQSISFYIVNEKTGQKKRRDILIDWNLASNDAQKSRGEAALRVYLTKEINAIDCKKVNHGNL